MKRYPRFLGFLFAFLLLTLAVTGCDGGTGCGIYVGVNQSREVKLIEVNGVWTKSITIDDIDIVWGEKLSEDEFQALNNSTRDDFCIVVSY